MITRAHSRSHFFIFVSSLFLFTAHADGLGSSKEGFQNWLKSTNCGVFPQTDENGSADCKSEGGGIFTVKNTQLESSLEIRTSDFHFIVMFGDEKIPHLIDLSKTSDQNLNCSLEPADCLIFINLFLKNTSHIPECILEIFSQFKLRMIFGYQPKKKSKR